jgi:hypothetical protein
MELGLFLALVGEVEVGIYINVKSDAYTPTNKADDYMKFGEYIDMIRKGLQRGGSSFNLFEHAPAMLEDFSWPEQYSRGFVYPMLFTGIRAL